MIRRAKDIDEHTPWQEMTPAGEVYEAATARYVNTGAWRTDTPVLDAEKCRSCLLCVPFCPDSSLPVQDGKLVGLTPREQPPKPEPEPDLTPQFRTAMLSYAATSTAIPDSYALDMSDLFPTWAAVLADGEELPAGRILNDEGQLYRVVQAVTPQEDMPPHDDGMLAIYRPIDREHAGTVDDPIPWVYGMDCHAGKHYSYNGKVYKVAEGGDMIPCTWAPDTPDMWQWVEV